MKPCLSNFDAPQKKFDRLNYESKGENYGMIRNWGMLLGLQHFGGGRVCWSFGMGLG
jgi:hypothetical protein